MTRALNILIVCTISTALQVIRPGAEWSMTGNQYEGLNWLDKTQAKPTERELTEEITACQTREAQEKQARDQAKLDLNNPTKTDAEFRAAIIKYLELDKP